MTPKEDQQPMTTREGKRSYFTIRHAETFKPLGLGGSLSRERARELLLAARPTPLIRTEWYVTEWYGNGADGDDIVCQTNADEWLAAATGDIRP